MNKIKNCGDQLSCIGFDPPKLADSNLTCGNENKKLIMCRFQKILTFPKHSHKDLMKYTNKKKKKKGGKDVSSMCVFLYVIL